MHQGSCETTLGLDRDGLDGIFIVVDDSSVEPLPKEKIKAYEPQKDIVGNSKILIGGGVIALIIVIFLIRYVLFGTNQINREKKLEPVVAGSVIVPHPNVSVPNVESTTEQGAKHNFPGGQEELSGKPTIAEVATTTNDDNEEGPLVNIGSNQPTVVVETQTESRSLAIAKAEEQIEQKNHEEPVVQEGVADESMLQPVEADILNTELDDKTQNEIPVVESIAIREFEFPVKFSFGSSRLRSVSKQQRIAIDEFLSNCEEEIQVIGQTCDIGARAYNQILGMARAKSVKAYLMTQAAFSGSYVTLSEVVDSIDPGSSSFEKRAQNRRVVLRCVPNG